jgi:predicted aspartyl protease
MKLLLKDNIPFITITATYKGTELEVPDILIDTGSATTILSTDIVTSIGIVPSPEDILHTIRGVGGREVVFRRTLDYFQVGDCRLSSISIDIGGMDYGFEMNGILGMDVLTSAGAIINLQDISIKFAHKY